MMEWMEKYREAPREATALTIDKPMLLFFGLTLPEFTLAPLVFIAVMFLSSSSFAIVFGTLGGALLAWATREYRRHFPARFLQHWSWSMGLQTIEGLPKLFHSQRYRFFGP